MGRESKTQGIYMCVWLVQSETTAETTQRCKRTTVLVSLAQLCAILCDPTDCSPPGSSVHGILQTRTLEWVAISSSR